MPIARRLLFSSIIAKGSSRQWDIFSLLEYLTRCPHICVYIVNLGVRFGRCTAFELYAVFNKLPALRSVLLLSVEILPFTSIPLQIPLIRDLDCLSIPGCTFIGTAEQQGHPLVELIRIFASIKALKTPWNIYPGRLQRAVVVSPPLPHKTRVDSLSITSTGSEDECESVVYTVESTIDMENVASLYLTWRGCNRTAQTLIDLFAKMKFLLLDIDAFDSVGRAAQEPLSFASCHCLETVVFDAFCSFEHQRNLAGTNCFWTGTLAMLSSLPASSPLSRLKYTVKLCDIYNPAGFIFDGAEWHCLGCVIEPLKSPKLVHISFIIVASTIEDSAACADSLEAIKVELAQTIPNGCALQVTWDVLT